MTLNAHDLLAEDEPEEVEVVDPHRPEHGVRLLEEVVGQVRLLAVAQVAEDDVRDVPDHAPRDGLAQRSAGALGAPVLDDAELQPARVREVGELTRLGELCDERLLDEHVAAGLQARADSLPVRRDDRM